MPPLTASERKLAALQPIRDAAMGKTIEGHFGVEIDRVTGAVRYVNISLRGGGSLHIRPGAPGLGLDVSLRA